MPGCYVPFCPMGLGVEARKSTKTDDGRTPTLFSAPSDPKTLKVWSDIIKRSDTPMDSKSKVCELHFLKEDLLYRKQMKFKEVGRDHLDEHEKIIVKRNGPDVVPKILPTEYPNYMKPKIVKKRKKVSRAEYTANKRKYIKKRPAKNDDDLNSLTTVENETHAVENETDAVENETNNKTAESLEQEYIDPYRCPQESFGDDIHPDILHLVNNLELDQITTPQTEIDENIANTKDNNVPVPAVEKAIINDHNKKSLPEIHENIQNTDDKIKIGVNHIAITDNLRTTSFFDEIYENKDKVLLPSSQWSIVNGTDYVQFIKTNDDNWIDCSLKLNRNLTIELKANNKNVDKSAFDVGVIYNFSKLNVILSQIDAAKLCAGDSDGHNSKKCFMLLHKSNCIRCKECARENKKQKQQMQRNQCDKIREQKLKNAKRRSYSYYKLKKRVKQQKMTIKNCKDEMKRIKITAVEEVIAKLPSVTQEMVRTCIRSSQVEDKRNMRYSATWLYNCILLKIRSTSTYEFLRRHNYLPLPCANTVRNHLKTISADYGFNMDVLKLMEKKADYIPEREKHGTIILDEMKLTPALHVNKKSLKITGFVNINKNNECDEDVDDPDVENVIGDHGLVFLFQSYAGKWMQVVGTFLTKGCANGQELHHLVLECIFLLENAGYRVDGVCTDGATWNYNMFSRFGVGKGEGINVTNYCEHPYDQNRKLFFFSDFCHLAKNLRNAFFKSQEFNTPDGYVQKRHWDELLKYESRNNNQCIKSSFKLTYDKLNPSDPQKMKVLWAFQIFSLSVSTSMTYLREEGHPEFIDSHPSSEFALRVNNFIDAMNNLNCHIDKSLCCGSSAERVIREFMQYMEEWRVMNKNSKSGYISKQTSKGFFITMKSTLGLMEYLTSSYSFNYILTRRLNSDSIEHFFSLVRNTGGTDDHPDSTKFIQIVSLLSLYSLIKPPKSANISGEEIFSLISQGEFKDNVERNSIKCSLEEKLDAILDDERYYSFIPDILEDDEEELDEYDSVDLFAVSYVAGYVARKAKVRWCKNCEHCQSKITSENPTPHSRLIELRNKGSLIYPSTELEDLIVNIEKSIQSCLKEQQLQCNYILQLLDAIKGSYNKNLAVGCETHKMYLTKCIIKFFVITRLHFICKNASSGSNKKHQIHNKIAKM